MSAPATVPGIVHTLRTAYRCPLGLTLVELVVVIALAGVLTSGAWAWLWSMQSAAVGMEDEAEARSGLAYARRTVLADVGAASRVVVGDAVACTPHCLGLQIVEDGDTPRTVVIQWNEARGTLWRDTPSCHLVGGVEDFQIAYLDQAGCPLTCGAAGLDAATARAVRGVRIVVQARVRQTLVEQQWQAWLSGVPK